ncbi:serine protease [Amycolatopsis arida]|uniref:Serine protease n=1 Tax=Amycolatopsis arida TaxID=587909 RepID=A0A1I5WKB3_9PSEU|nr:S8 family serine peptidase [Amycolatopsis arida]TDX92330.1 PKD domain-containing protein [Amycolatopsis arida]SFQ20233.1 serine protease [Amycolatopsis arida]
MDLHDNPNQGNDCNNHGTHVSGIVGGETRGVAKAVDLVSVRVLGCDGFGKDVDVIEAAEWITKNAEKPAVANLSVYTDDPDIAAEAISNSISSGIQWSLITGNNGRDACDHGPGGQVPSALQVGNSTSNDTRRFDSNHGRCMDLFAPGTDINSAYRSSDSSYGTLSGTSMAAPHVAGAMALRLHDAPSSSPAQLHSWVMDNASTGKLSGLSGDTPNKLLYVPNDGSQPPGDPVAQFTASCSDDSLTCTFDGSGSSDPDGGITSYTWDFGDGTTGTGATTRHTYLGHTTNYTATLTVTDNDGNTATTHRTIQCWSFGTNQGFCFGS